jgi:predicted permease
VTQDLRYGLRQLRRSPGFAVTAIATLALGIGSTTAIFSVVNTVLLKPLGIPDPDRLVVLLTSDPSTGEDTEYWFASPARFIHWRNQSSVLQYVSAFRSVFINYTGGDTAEQWRSLETSADTFRCLGIPVFQGRTFTPQEDLPNGDRVVVIGRNLWVRRFASDPRIVGKTISLNGEAHTVIGIAGGSAALGGFLGRPDVDVYVPFRIDPKTTDQGVNFPVMARLKPGVTLEQAKARLQTSVGEYRGKFPGAIGPKASFTLKPFREQTVGGYRALLLTLLGAVGLVLLIACANVANLLLARAAGRRREIAIRAASGAPRGRIVRQLLTESLLLSFAGGALGLIVGYAGIRALLRVNTVGLPLVGGNGAAVILDWRVMGFALTVSILTGVIFGLLPALQSSRADLNSMLKESSGRSGTGLRQNKARAALVVSEVTLAVILLTASALGMRSFIALYQVDPGFDAKNVLTAYMSFVGPKYSQSANVGNTLRAGLERLRAMPGVVAAGTTCCVPLQGEYDLGFEIVGRPFPAGYHGADVGWTMASSGFFDVFKIPVKRGRDFTERDDSAAPPVAIVNERLAQQYWKNADPLKDRILIAHDGGLPAFHDEPARQIVGIVGDIRDESLADAPRPMIYVPQAQLTDAETVLFAHMGPTGWIVRTRSEPHALLPAIREQLRQATGLPVSEGASMDEVVSHSTSLQRFAALLMSVFGSSALLLAAVGIYGLMAYTVEQRTQEIGIRLALGATANGVRNVVVRQGMILALSGVAIGSVGALALARVIASGMFGVKPHDPVVFVSVPLVLTAVALLAVWVPASRASAVNPVDSLRYE